MFLNVVVKLYLRYFAFDILDVEALSFINLSIVFELCTNQL